MATTETTLPVGNGSPRPSYHDSTNPTEKISPVPSYDKDASQTKYNNGIVEKEINRDSNSEEEGEAFDKKPSLLTRLWARYKIFALVAIEALFTG